MVAALFFAAGSLLCAPTATAAYAMSVPPSFVDRANGFVYFVVYNGWEHTVDTLFGRVYGYGLPGRPGSYLINSPDQPAMKVSIGVHRPGRVALYRFKVPEGWTRFPRFGLTVGEKQLFYPRNVRP